MKKNIKFEYATGKPLKQLQKKYDYVLVPHSQEFVVGITSPFRGGVSAVENLSFLKNTITSIIGQISEEKGVYGTYILANIHGRGNVVYDTFIGLVQINYTNENLRQYYELSM